MIRRFSIINILILIVFLTAALTREAFAAPPGEIAAAGGKAGKAGKMASENRD